MPPLDLDSFVTRHMEKHGKAIPARVQAAMALLEKLRDDPSLDLADHKKKGSSGLESHETFGNRVHERLGLDRINKNHGRRSSSIGDWGQDLLDLVKDGGFERASAAAKTRLLDDAQDRLGTIIRGILEQDPIEVRVKGRSAETVIRDVLEQAEEKGKTGDVAQYLVSAKLMLRLNREIPVVGSNLGDRRSHADVNPRTGDVEIENATIEVAVGLPDEKHLTQISEALEDTDAEVWLLTRHDRVATWRTELNATDGLDYRRVVVNSVEAFVGQNITEMGAFSSSGRASQLRELFKLYNERWVAQCGTPGIRIEVR